MSKKLTVSKALAKKIAKAKRVETSNTEVSQLPDIEELVTVKSEFFSPVQTRQQRLNHNNPLKALQLQQSTPKPALIARKNLTQLTMKRKEESKSEDEVSKIIPPKKKVPITDTIVNSKAKTDVQLWQPSQWQDVLNNIRKMRSESLAPVDTMGCHKCSDDNADEKTQRFQKLVALMLSSQTKDETTFDAMQRLRAACHLTPNSIATMETEKLEKLLNPVSFYRNKAKSLQKTSKILIDQYDSDIPNEINDLVKLPGVGPKMAHICMATAWNITTGIGVDVHVHRICNRLHWVPKPTKEPEQTRIALEEWLPRESWREVNHLLVGFGQTVCKPVNPNCDNCLNHDICPSANITANPTRKNVGGKGNKKQK